MLELGVNGYTRQEVIDILHGRSGGRGEVKFRYDLLNRDEVKIGELLAQPGKVSMDSLAEIKRTAIFQVAEQEGKDIDWLNDRIRPVFCLRMPSGAESYEVLNSVSAAFSRASAAYLSSGEQVAAYNPRYEKGKYGKALMVEGGTTNIIPNPSFETNLSEWTAYGNHSGARITTDKYVGSACLKLTSAGAGGISSGPESGYITTIPDIASGTQYTVSFYAKSISGNNVLHCELAEVNNPQEFELTTSWKRYIATFTATSQKDLYFWLNGAGECLIDGVQVEAKPYATSYTDNTRSAESLSIPSNVLNPEEGTVECWIKAQDLGNRRRDIFAINDSASSERIRLSYNISGQGLELLWWPAGGNLVSTRMAYITVSTEWVHVGFRYKWNGSGYEVALIHNGRTYSLREQVSCKLSNVTDIFLGHSKQNGELVYFADMLFDDLRISKRAKTNDEIMETYKSLKSKTFGDWTTAKFDFDENLFGNVSVISLNAPARWIEWPLGIFLLSSPRRQDENKKIKRLIEAYDASLIIKEDKFVDRYKIASGTKYIDAITTILNSAGIWKINILDHPGTLAVDKEFEIGTTKLYAINELLAAINYTSLWVDENGYFVAHPYVLPSNREHEYEYKTNDFSVILPGSAEELDLFAVPNRWVRYVSNPDRSSILRSEYTNDMSTSPTSTVNRGRVIVDIEPVEDIYDQTTLDEFVKRIAYNASQVYGRFDFSTALMPHHSYYNCLFVEHTDFSIANKYMETSWSMDLQPGGKMNHSCRRVIHI